MKHSKLVDWNNRYDKININLELEFLKICEKNCNISLNNIARFINFLKCLKDIPSRPQTILDVGGNVGTARWLQAKFIGSYVTILNKSVKEIGKWPNSIKADAENFKSPKKYDLIFLGDIIEHAYNPDGMIASSILALNPGGIMVITTLNLACFYNRIFLLLGWSPGGYFPSLRYMTGNPLFKNKIDQFGTIVDHKSVFTWKGLIELLNYYDLKMIKSIGFDILKNEKIVKTPKKNYRILNQKTRVYLDLFLPQSLKPGMMFICQLDKNADLEKIAKGILVKNIWDM